MGRHCYRFNYGPIPTKSLSVDGEYKMTVWCITPHSPVQHACMMHRPMNDVYSQGSLCHWSFVKLLPVSRLTPLHALTFSAWSKLTKLKHVGCRWICSAAGASLRFWNKSTHLQSVDLRQGEFGPNPESRLGWQPKLNEGLRCAKTHQIFMKIRPPFQEIWAKLWKKRHLLQKFLNPYLDADDFHN